MKTLKTRFAVICALAVAALASFGGAAETKAAKDGAQQKDSPYKQVIVEVNGAKITRGRVDHYVGMMATLLKNKRKETPPALLAKFKAKNLKPLSDELFRRTVISTCLAQSNITVSVEAREAVEREALKNFGKRGQTMAELKAVLRKAGCIREFERNLEDDARLRTFLTTTYSNEYFITEAKVDEVKRDVAAYNERAAATNALKQARAAEILRRARAGEDFARLADEFSEDEDKEAGGDLGDCDESDFVDDKSVWRALNALPEGAVSDLYETDDGYALYQVVRRNTPEESQTGGASLTLARIFFRRAYVFPPQSDDEFREDVETETREKLLAGLFRKFRAQSKVVYPNGPVEAKP